MVKYGTQFLYNGLVWTVGKEVRPDCYEAEAWDDDGRRHQTYDASEKLINANLVDYRNLPVGTKILYDDETYIVTIVSFQPDGTTMYSAINESQESMSTTGYDINFSSIDFRPGLIMVSWIPSSTQSVPKWNEQKSICSHKNKYINILSNTLKFWYCPDCKKDLGDA